MKDNRRNRLSMKFQFDRIPRTDRNPGSRIRHLLQFRNRFHPLLQPKLEKRAILALETEIRSPITTCAVVLFAPYTFPMLPVIAAFNLSSFSVSRVTRGPFGGNDRKRSVRTLPASIVNKKDSEADANVAWKICSM